VNESPLNRDEAHTIKLTLDVVPGASNDVVHVYIDGEHAYGGTSWENYYRFDPEAAAEQAPRDVDTIIIQARGGSNPENDGKGFLFDNLSMSSSDLVTPEEPEQPEEEISNNDNDNNDNDHNGSNGRRRGSSRRPFSEGQVLGVSFAEGEVLGATLCPAALTSYMRSDKVNDPEQVKKLQAFLNEELDLKLEVSGIYNAETIAAVNAFQVKYTSKVLTPWGITAPTGYAYKLTTWWINAIICGTTDTAVMPQI
jgi:hypothetical protein